MLAEFAWSRFGITLTLKVNENDNVFGGLLGNGVISAYFEYAYIGISSIIIIVAFIGCCAVITKNKCIFITYTCLLAIYTVISIGIVVASFVVPAKLGRLTENLSKTIITAYGGGTLEGGLLPTDKLIDILQQDNQCCGYSNGDDYANSVYAAANVGNAPWPESCCVPVGTTGTDISACRSIAEAKFAVSTNSYANVGCFEKLEKALKKYFYIIGGVEIVLVILEIVATIFNVKDIKHNRVEPK